MKSDEILQYTVEANVKFGNQLKRKLKNLVKDVTKKQVERNDYQKTIVEIRKELYSIINWVDEIYKSDECHKEKEIKLWK